MPVRSAALRSTMVAVAEVVSASPALARLADRAVAEAVATKRMKASDSPQAEMVKPILAVAAVAVARATILVDSSGAAQTAAMAAAVLSSYVVGIAFAALR